MRERPPAWRVSGGRKIVGFGLLVSAWLCASYAASDAGAAGGARKGFSPQEERELRAGELVVRRKTEQRGSLRLLGGTSWQLIDAPVDAVLRALLDVSRYERMLPTVTGASLIGGAGSDYRKVRLEHKHGPVDIVYALGIRVDSERKELTFMLEDAPAGQPRAAWGFFSVRPYGAKQSLLAYGVMADPGDDLLLTLVRGTVHGWLLSVPRQVKWFVESREGRARYAAPRGP